MALLGCFPHTNPNNLATKIRGAEKNGKSDPFIEMHLESDHKIRWKTPVIKNTRNPKFMAEYVISVGRLADSFAFEIFDWNRFSKDKSLGKANLAVKAILELAETGGLFDLVLKGKQVSGVINVFARAFLLEDTMQHMKVRNHVFKNMPDTFLKLPPARLVLEKEVYRPGEVMRGHLVWMSHESIECREAYFQVTGRTSQAVVEEDVHPNEAPYATETTVLSDVGRIFGEDPGLKDSEDAKQRKLKKGKVHIWAFEFLLPERLPPSCGGHRGFVCNYTIRAIADKADGSGSLFDYNKEFYIVPPLDSFLNPTRPPRQLELRSTSLNVAVVPFDWDEPTGFQIEWGPVSSNNPAAKSTSNLWVINDGIISTTVTITPSSGAIAPTATLKRFCVSIINHFAVTYRQPEGAHSTNDPNWKCLPFHMITETFKVPETLTMRENTPEPIILQPSFQLPYHGYSGCSFFHTTCQSVPSCFFPEFVESCHYLEITASEEDIENPEHPRRVTLGRRPINLIHRRFLENDQPVAPHDIKLLVKQFRVIEVSESLVGGDKIRFIAPTRMRTLDLMGDTLSSAAPAHPNGAVSFGSVLSSEVFMKENAITPWTWRSNNFFWQPAKYDWPEVTKEQIRGPSCVIAPRRVYGAIDDAYKP